MADMAIFIGWGEPVRGREQKALQVFNESIEYYQRLQAEGTIESFEPVLLEPHGGDLGGFALLRGEQDKLLGLLGSEEFDRLISRTRLIVENLGVVPAIIGDRLQQGMQQYQQQLGELA